MMTSLRFMICSSIIMYTTFVVKTNVIAFQLLPPRANYRGQKLTLFQIKNAVITNNRPSSTCMMKRRRMATMMTSSSISSSHLFDIRGGGGHGSSYFSSTSLLSSSSSENKYTTLDPLTSGSSPTTTKRNLQNALQVAENAAYQAGEIMKRTSGKIAISKTKANTADLVTESDIECQKVILNVIQQSFPNDGFLGEEDVDPGSFASSKALEDALSGGINDLNRENDGEKFVWIVDPIDGTTNFQAGLPMFCASIGLVLLQPDREPEVVLGVIYNPVLNDMVSAVRGRGCYVNGNNVHDNDDDDNNNTSNDNDDDNEIEEGISLDKAMVNVGFPISSEGTLRASSRAVTALATKVRGLRMIASASQVMSWVAQSKLNAYVSWDLNAWDIAAGMVIVEESGGFISDFDGDRANVMTRDMIISCNEGNNKHGLSTAILDVLTENDCLKAY